MSLFRLDASIRVEGSHSRAIADLVEQEWRNARPGEPIIRRHVGVDPIPATAWSTAVFAGWTPEESRTDEQKAAQALAATLTDELVGAMRCCLQSRCTTSASRSTSRRGLTCSSPTPGWPLARSPSWPASLPSW
jgi:hypothetical protein